MAPNLPDVLGRGIERGTEAVFAVDSLSQLGDAVDLEALEQGDPGAMDFEHMGELVGQMTGRLVVKQTVGRYTPGQFAEQTVGYAIGGAIGREGGRLVLQVVENQRGDPVEVEIEVVDEGEVDANDDIRDLGDGDDRDDLGGPDGVDEGNTDDDSADPDDRDG